MNNKFVIAIFAISIPCSYFFRVPVEELKMLIPALLTVFSIFFGFYITSYAVFATSKYLSKLYEIEDENDNSKTLLHNLLDKFKNAVYCLLMSIVYLIILYILILIGSKYANYAEYLAYCLWFVLLINFCFIFHTISYFMKVTEQSAKE